VLSRKENEWIDVGGGAFTFGNLSIVVVAICGDRVKLGFEGPRDVTVHRREVTEAIAAEKGGVE